MMRPKLSVITVTFNAQHTLPRTLDSVANQTYSEIEHIVMDGQSKDGTLTLLQQATNPRLVWKSEPDNGLYDAMNKAAQLATGDYLCFLNAGDTFHAEDSVHIMMTQAQANYMPDIIYGETAIVDDNGTFLHLRRLRAPRTLSWTSFKHGMVVCHQAFVVKRTLFEPYNLRYRFSSDFDWCVRLMKKAHSIHNTFAILVDYLNEGMTTANHKASLKERFAIMSHHYGTFSTGFYHLWFAVRQLIK